MNYEITALVVKNKNTGEVLDIQSIDDMYCEVCVEYPAYLISQEDLLNYFGSFERAGKYLDLHKGGRSFALQYEAKDIPSLGDVEVGVETRQITDAKFMSLPKVK